MSNSLAKVYPELVSEWSNKNYPLTPDNITFDFNKTVLETDQAIQFEAWAAKVNKNFETKPKDYV